MLFTSERRHDDDLVERRFRLGDVPGILWTPAAASALPLVLIGHPGGIDSLHPRLLARARSAAESGFASVTIELPGAGERERMPQLERARDDLRAALAAGDAPARGVVDRLVLPLVARAVPEWRAAIDAVLALPEAGGPVGYSGGPIAIGIHLALAEPRVVAAGLFAGSFVPRSTLAEAHRVTIPVHVLLQWDDEGNDRALALELFDALGSKEKTLQANLGGHRGVPAHAGEDAGRFFARHLTPGP